jgi:hypothetical protein
MRNALVPFVFENPDPPPARALPGLRNLEDAVKQSAKELTVRKYSRLPREIKTVTSPDQEVGHDWSNQPSEV